MVLSVLIVDAMEGGRPVNYREDLRQGNLNALCHQLQIHQAVCIHLEMLTFLVKSLTEHFRFLSLIFSQCNVLCAGKMNSYPSNNHNTRPLSLCLPITKAAMVQQLLCGWPQF